MKSKKIIIFFIALLIASMPVVGNAATQTMMEMDEVSESGYMSLSGADIDARFPIRVGGVSTGSDYVTNITAPYNEPRIDKNNVEYCHTGVDFSASSGTNLYGVYSNGKVYEVTNVLGDVLGRHVRVQYKHVENNQDGLLSRKKTS